MQFWIISTLQRKQHVSECIYPSKAIRGLNVWFYVINSFRSFCGLNFSDNLSLINTQKKDNILETFNYIMPAFSPLQWEMWNVDKSTWYQKSQTQFLIQKIFRSVSIFFSVQSLKFSVHIWFLVLNIL